MARCSSGPNIDEINAAKNKYFQQNAIFTDTLINYEIKGDSMLLEFVNAPSTDLWYVSLAYPNSIITDHELKEVRDGRIIIANENLSEFNDSIVMNIYLYPGNGIVFTEGKFRDIDWFMRYSVKSGDSRKGKFSLVKIPGKICKVNLNFLKEIEDVEMKRILTDTLLETIRYEAIKINAPDFIQYIDDIKGKE